MLASTARRLLLFLRSLLGQRRMAPVLLFVGFVVSFILLVKQPPDFFLLVRRHDLMNDSGDVDYSASDDGWKDEQRMRVKKINDTCEMMKNQSSSEVMLLPANIVVDTRHRVVFCAIPKAACSSWRSIMAHLNQPTAEESPMLSLPVHDVSFMRSVGIVELNQFSTEEQSRMLKTYPSFFVVRHPFERLVSAFREKFQRHNRHTRYFHSKYGRRIIRAYRAGRRAGDVTFSEFVSWLVDGGWRTDEHWTSYQALCRPCHVHYTHVINYDSFDVDTTRVLRLLFNASTEFFPRRNSQRTNSKLLIAHFLSLLSEDQISKLHSTYEHDFDMFGFSKNLENTSTAVNEYL